MLLFSSAASSHFISVAVTLTGAFACTWLLSLDKTLHHINTIIFIIIIINVSVRFGSYGGGPQMQRLKLSFAYIPGLQKLFYKLQVGQNIALQASPDTCLLLSHSPAERSPGPPSMCSCVFTNIFHGVRGLQDCCLLPRHMSSLTPSLED